MCCLHVPIIICSSIIPSCHYFKLYMCIFCVSNILADIYYARHCAHVEVSLFFRIDLQWGAITLKMDKPFNQTKEGMDEYGLFVILHKT